MYVPVPQNVTILDWIVTIQPILHQVKMKTRSDPVDDAFLAEVAGFLGDCDASIMSNEIKNDEMVTANDSDLLLAADKRHEIRNAQAAKRRERYRQKLKDEKEELVRQENELSKVLAKLQAAHAGVRAAQMKNLALGAWRAIAIRQLERRMQAEQQRKLLRAEVIGRSRAIVQMGALLQENKHTHQKLLEGDQVEETRANGEDALLKTFLVEIDKLYAQTNEVWRDVKFKSSATPAYDLKPNWKDNALYFDSADRTVIPYPFDVAKNAAIVIFMSDPHACLETVEPNKVKDTVTMKYQRKYQLRQGGSVDLTICGAGKTYKEHQQLVFIWRGLTEGQGKFDGIQADEICWVIVRPSSGVESSGESTTVLESYSRLVPVAMKGCDYNVDPFMKILAESGEGETEVMMQMMEKLMLNDLSSKSS
ncbi:unnamed protein product [Phytophthora fragariaefolia]|uniref:Unnamed protein product n=1 Tax=Phytophthora fragariaefolia TaxID=1490495 RepID=A0A9W6X9U2_9STRA|nr:unnamed protein product [Phytophthora fragariaefolia]